MDADDRQLRRATWARRVQLVCLVVFLALAVDSALTSSNRASAVARIIIGTVWLGVVVAQMVLARRKQRRAHERASTE